MGGVSVWSCLTVPAAAPFLSLSSYHHRTVAAAYFLSSHGHPHPLHTLYLLPLLSPSTNVTSPNQSVGAWIHAAAHGRDAGKGVFTRPPPQTLIVEASFNQGRVTAVRDWAMNEFVFGGVAIYIYVYMRMRAAVAFLRVCVYVNTHCDETRPCWSPWPRSCSGACWRTASGTGGSRR